VRYMGCFHCCGVIMVPCCVSSSNHDAC
jgi:hypothetical protein